MSENESPGGANERDGYLMVVGVFMAIILVILAVMWMRENRWRKAAERRAVAAEDRATRQEALLLQLMREDINQQLSASQPTASSQPYQGTP